ncbi:hypothetical protein [Megamonas funiformis]|jgi:hypothetical protein|uniref:hypothetical protein n=1 Tax=Megamonas funiformis TaxID=437897 RepID=UPI0022E537E2|nr:hypothetical protein [Megamonas funiformis]
MEETKYYVFDCDTDLYKLSQKINKIFKEVKEKRPLSIIIVQYGYAEICVDDNIGCSLDINGLALDFETSCISFDTKNKVLSLAVTFYENDCPVIKVKIIDKG